MPSSSPAAKKKFTTERTETTEKSTSARASRDCKVTVHCLLTHSLCLHVFSVISVASVVNPVLWFWHDRAETDFLSLDKRNRIG
jgi:hypothetical protein